MIISSTVFPVISEGSLGVDTAAVTIEVVPLVDATASEEDVCAPAVAELETGAEAEVEGREPKLAAVVVAVVTEEAGIVVLVVGRVKLGNALVVPEELVPVENPRPVKELVAAADEEAAPVAEVVEGSANPVKAGAEVAVAVAVAAVCVDGVAAEDTGTAGVELLVVVVAAENNDGVEEAPKSGFEADEVAAAAALLKENVLWLVEEEAVGVKENPDEREGDEAAVVAAVVVFRKDEEPPPNENPLDDADTAGVEVEVAALAELAPNKVDPPNGDDEAGVEDDPNNGEDVDVAAVTLVEDVDDGVPNKGVVVVVVA